MTGYSYLYQVANGGKTITWYSQWLDTSTGVAWNALDNKVYVLGKAQGALAQYTIGTVRSNAWPASGFNNPVGLALDPSGTSALVAEQGSHTVRRVTLSSGAIATTGYWPYNPVF